MNEGAHLEMEGKYRRRESDTILGQVKALWPFLFACCVGYAAWEVQRSKLSDTAALATETAKDVGVLKQTVAVQTAVLMEIKDAVKDIAKNQRRRRED